MHLFEMSTTGFMGGYQTIQNLEVCNGGKGIIVNGIGYVVRSNYCHDGYSSGIFLYHSAFSQVYSNVVTRTGDTQIYLQMGGNNWVHHNTCSYSGGSNGTPAIGGIVVFPNIENCGIGLETGTNNIIEYNSVTYERGSFFDYWLEVNSDVRYNYGFHATMAAAPCGTGLRVHHNIFHLDGSGTGISASHAYDPVNSPAPDTGTNYIYNNVIYNFQNYAFYTSGVSAPGVAFRNNIAVLKSTTPSFLDISVGVSSDYNLFYCTAGTSLGWVWNDTNLFTTLPSFRTGTAQEAHSLCADPQFVSTNPVTASDFQLKATSPCINTGQDLKAAGFLTATQPYQDYFGTSIPQGAGPDIGPYERVPMVLPPASNLQVTH
jgi:hypothetical protein